MKQMTKQERILAALGGDEVDTLPYSMWLHFPGDDLIPESAAEKTFDFYQKYDLDFIKTCNNSMYALEDYGCKSDYSAVGSGGDNVLIDSPIKTAEDWCRLKEPDIHTGVYGRELKYLELLLKKTKGKVPVIFTIYSPLTTANKMAGSRKMYGKDNLLFKHIEEGHQDKLQTALEVISQTTCKLVKEALDRGADGIYLASQTSSYDFFTDGIFRRFGEPYDRQVLDAAKDGWFNTLHAHGNNIMFDILKDYPVHAFQWHAFEALPTLKDAKEQTGKCLMGGIQRKHITSKDRKSIVDEITRCCRELQCRGHILSPGCAMSYPLSHEMLSFVKEAKEEVEAKYKSKSTETITGWVK